MPSALAGPPRENPNFPTFVILAFLRPPLTQGAVTHGVEVAQIANAGMFNCALYAVGSNGASDHQICSTRSSVLNAVFPEPRGRSVIADPQILGKASHGVDPTIDMAAAPVVTWATG